MHLLYCDESNLDERDGDFLIYGGMMISSEQARGLSDAIERVRSGANIPRDFRLKFAPKPENLGHDEYIAVKQAIIEAAVEHDAGLLVYAILHNIATNPDEARRFGINQVCSHFHVILQRLQSQGLVLIDRFNDKGNAIELHLAEKFSVGLKGMPFSDEIRLSRILGFHYSAVGQSHFPSLVDVVLGSLRFAMNAHTRKQEKNLKTAQRLLNLVSPLFVRSSGSDEVPEVGFILSPKSVKAPSYLEKYRSMKRFLAEGDVRLQQEITSEACY